MLIIFQSFKYDWAIFVFPRQSNNQIYIVVFPTAIDANIDDG